MMRAREKPKQLEKTDKFCPFLDKGCIHDNCELYSIVLGHCSLNVLPYNIYKLDRTIEKATRDITSRMY
jgi:hypothetical protein